MDIGDALLRLVSAILNVSLWWDIISLILPLRHYHGEPHLTRWRGLLLLIALLAVLVGHATLGALLAWLLGLLIVGALVCHCLVLYERRECPDR